MKKKLPPLNWLRSFESSARHLNFTQAANELNLTQAAVSQQIRGLESQLGCTLFKRLPRSLQLTDAGLAYLPAVRESIERLTVITDELFGQGRSQSLTIKVNLVFYTCWLAPRLKSFRALHPDVKLRFTSNIWFDNKDQKDSHLEIRYGQGLWKGMVAERLTWDMLIPVCAPKLVNGLLPPNTPDELNQYCLLHVLGYEEGWGFWLRESGFGHIDTDQGIQFDTLVSSLETAAQGLGIALGRSSLIKPMIDDGKLITPFNLPISTPEAFYLVYSSSDYSHPHAEVFREWIKAESLIAKRLDDAL